MKTLPKKLKPYKILGPFTQETTPKGFLKEHATKAGVWGLLKILRGELEYTIAENETVLLSVEKMGVIEPQKKHCVKPRKDVYYTLTFYS